MDSIPQTVCGGFTHGEAQAMVVNSQLLKEEEAKNAGLARKLKCFKEKQA